MSNGKLGRVASRRATRTSVFFLAAALTTLGFAAVFAAPVGARGDERDSAAKLVARTMFNPEFRVKTFHGGEWLGNGDFYLAIEAAASGGGSDIVRYQTSAGAREILVAASRLIPAGEKAPLPL